MSEIGNRKKTILKISSQEPWTGVDTGYEMYKEKNISGIKGYEMCCHDSRKLQDFITYSFI